MNGPLCVVANFEFLACYWRFIEVSNTFGTNNCDVETHRKKIENVPKSIQTLTVFTPGLTLLRPGLILGICSLGASKMEGWAEIFPIFSEAKFPAAEFSS